MKAIIPRDWMPRRSLRVKILLVVMLATCSALLLSASALLAYEIVSNRNVWTNDIRSQAELLAQSVTPTLVFDDPKAATDALDAFKLRGQIEVAAIFDARNRLFASYARQPNGSSIAPSRPDIDGLEVDIGDFRLTRAVAQDGERLGTIYLYAHHDLWGRIVDYLWILALASTAGLALAALIFRQLHPSITRPILAMADLSRRIIEDRNYELRVAASSDDEVGVLVTAFNNMLQDLEAEMKERKSAEDALRVADRRKDEFLATLAHELRNPLAPLSAGLALLKLGDGDPQLRARMRDMMDRQLKQMVRLIDDLLEVSRITRGRLELRLETVDIGGIVRQALDSAESGLHNKNHTVTARVPDAPVWATVDPARLIQVLVNLLNNAGRYTPAHGKVELRVRELDGKVAIDVRDNGIGIEPAQQQAIFGMFVQVDTSLERGAAGLGIGLTIAKELVQLHGGSIEVESVGLGRGSTFTVMLPTVDAPHVPQQSQAVQAQAVATGTFDVLIADDNLDFAEGFASILRAEGHRVRIVHNGRDALVAINAARPAVAFLDVGMPEINGLELASRLRTDPGHRQMLLVAVTGWGQETDRLRVSGAGFDHHLVKPIDFADAFALLAALSQGDADRLADRLPASR